jgi:hypothetical protein
MNEINTQNNNLKEQILNKIKSGEVAMRPKAYFVCKVFLLMFVSFLTFIVSVILVSYLLFSIRVGGGIFLLGFGTRGFYEFILIFPWILLLINILLLLILDSLLKRFKFGYNRPMLYLFLVTLTAITFLASLINFTPFHKELMSRAEGQKLPMVGGFYKGLRVSHKGQGIFRGKVASTSVNSFTLERNEYDVGLEDMPIKVFVPPGMDMRDILKVGDQVFIAGDLVNSEIRAYGITIVRE